MPSLQLYGTEGAPVCFVAGDLVRAVSAEADGMAFRVATG